MKDAQADGRQLDTSPREAPAGVAGAAGSPNQAALHLESPASEPATPALSPAPAPQPISSQALPQGASGPSPRKTRSYKAYGARAAVAAIVVAFVVWWAPSLMEARTPTVILPDALPGSEGQVRYISTIEGGLQAPLSVAIGPLGDIYVADSENGSVKRFNDEGVLVANIGTKGGDEPAPGSLSRPTGVAVGPTGRVYVADVITGRISLFDELGNFVGYFGEGPDGQRPFSRASSLFYKDGRLYITDVEGHAVVVLGPDGALEQRIGDGRGTEPAQLSFPGAVWVDGDGSIYVADSNNQRIQVFDRLGKVFRLISYEAMNLPRGVVGDASGRLHVANTLGHTISVVTRDGKYLYSYGYSGSDWDGLGFPTGLAIAGDRLFVSDRANNRVQVFLILPGRK